MNEFKPISWRKNLPIMLLLLAALMSDGCSKPALGPGTDSFVRLLTYNIHHGANANDVFDLEATVATIRKSKANVIALQEVDRIWDARSNWIDEAEYLGDQLGMNYLFGPTLDKEPARYGVGEYGIMILSKFPIMDGRFYLLPSLLEQRGMLLCRVQTPEGTFPVVCTHLGLSTAERQNQIAAMLEYLPQQTDLVLMGDFNAQAEFAEFQPLREPYPDLQDKCGMGTIGTYQYNHQWVRTDYILGGIAWNPVLCKVVEDTSSDHRPVYVEVRREE